MASLIRKAPRRNTQLKIVVMTVEKKIKGRKKIQYGPTLYGLIYYYKQDKKIESLIQNYFLLWIEHKEFQKELEKEGFDVKGDLKKSKTIFQKYMKYFSAVEDQLEKIKSFIKIFLE